MRIKQFNGRIYGADLTPKERKALDIEINRQLIESHRKFTDDVDYMVLWCIRKCFKCGPKRLKRYYDFFIKANEDLIKHYEMADAGVFIARKELNKIGCNVEQWNSERSD